MIQPQPPRGEQWDFDEELESSFGEIRRLVGEDVSDDE